jgi:hypothetical protein
MKRVLTATLMVMLMFGVALADEPQAEIVFDKSVRNFGTFTEDNPVQTCTFTFKNTGKAPLVIIQAIATCGCTVPTYTDKPVPPGGTGIIEVTYNGKGRYPGHFKKVITVNTNAKQRLVRLAIEGEMTAKSESK